MSKKLELTWYGKDKPISVEPRILIKNQEYSFKKVLADQIVEENKGTFDNKLIYGDNLLALKALEKDYSGKIDCVYIDPPYNTGSAFEHYDDNLEHSIWLNMMRPRLEILYNLLNEKGTFWVQIDHNEFAYLKVLLDEIFGRSNFITCITVKAKAGGGVGQESYLFDIVEYILVYRKSPEVTPNNNPYKEEEIDSNVTNFYNNYINDYGKEKKVGTITGGNVGDIDVYEFEDFDIRRLTKKERTQSNYYTHFDTMFRTTNPQGGLMKRVMPQLPDKDLVAIEYVPSKGRNAGKRHRYYFYRGALVVWLKDTAHKNDKTKQISKLIRNDNLWIENLHQGIANEGMVEFRQSKKPEKLMERILSIATKPGDLVLDSFLGSGTTAAVAQKMGRRWIGIEMGDHAYTHTKFRLDNVINGKDTTGISKEYNWKGGGGYDFYELAPTLVKFDEFKQPVINKEYNPDMLASAIAIHEGYKYEPSKEVYWKQSYSSENSYLYVTTNHVNSDYLDAIYNSMKENEYLLINCKSFDSNLDKKYNNISIKKIPDSILKNCEFDKNDYSLNIINSPSYEEEDEFDE